MRSLTLILAALGCLALASPMAHAATFTDSGVIDGKSVSASADISISGGNLVIMLKNTSTLSDPAMAQVLTGLAFDMAGATVTGGKVEVAKGSILWEPKDYTSQDPTDDKTVRDESAFTDISKEWGYVNNAYLLGGIGPFDWAATATAFGAYGGGSATEFAAGEIEPSSAKLNGGDFGLIGKNADIYNDGLPSNWQVQDKVKITLYGSGFNLDNIANVAFFWGSSLDNTVIPEPGTLALLGMAGIFGGLYLRRRRKV